MGYHDHDDTTDPGLDHARTGVAMTVLGMGVRLLGVVLLLMGLWAGISVLLEAWGLYQQPERIERFAEAVERGSNLDAVFAPRPGEAPSVTQEVDEVSGTAAVPRPAPPPRQALRLSYFVAWFVVLLLLFIIGMLAMAAVSTGGQLALGEPRPRRTRRVEHREEVRRIRPAA